MGFEEELSKEWTTEMVVDEKNGCVQQVTCLPHELIGMAPAMRMVVSSQSLIKKDARIEGRNIIFPLRLGEFQGPAIPSFRFLIIREVKLLGDTVKVVEEGIGGVKSILKMWHANAERLEIDKTEAGKVQIHKYTAYYPALHRVVIGLDDTDTSTKGDTYITALEIGRHIAATGYGHFVKQNIIINYPLNPFKTTNNASSAMVFHVKPAKKPRLIEEVIRKAQELSDSRETGMAIMEGIEIPPELKKYSSLCKAKMLQVSDAEAAAKAAGIRLINISDRDRGKIGALSSLGLVDNPYKGITPSFKFRMLLKLGNFYTNLRDKFYVIQQK